MKKEDITSLIVYMFIIAVGIVYSFTVLRAHFDHSAIATPIAYAGVVILSLLAGIISTAILIEVGHVLGALVGKYSITSVCILFFTLYKDNDKWKFKFGGFDGLTGETKIYPKDKKSSPKAYLWFGTLLLAIWSIACFILFVMFNTNDPKQSDIAYFFLTIMVTVLICLLYNILPLKLDSKTDGFGLRMLSNPTNKQAYNEMLRVGKEVESGNDEVEIETTKEGLNNYTADMNLNKVYLLLDKKEYEEADKILDIILDNKKKISGKIFLRTLAMKIFNKVITSSREEAINYLNETVTMDLRRELSDDNTLMCIRAYILIEALTDNSKSECLLAIKKVNSAYKHLEKGRRLPEARMYNEAIDFVSSIHPKWEFDQYKIPLEDIK